MASVMKGKYTLHGRNADTEFDLVATGIDSEVDSASADEEDKPLARLLHVEDGD